MFGMKATTSLSGRGEGVVVSVIRGNEAFFTAETQRALRFCLCPLASLRFRLM